MKLLKKTGIYKAANVTFDPKTLDAFSYRWWRFVGVVEGVLVESTYRYSVTTAKHQRKVRRIMNELGIKPNLSLPLPRGVRHDQTLAEMIEEAELHLCDEFINEQSNKIRRNEKARERKAKEREMRARETIDRIGPCILGDVKDLAEEFKKLDNVIQLRKA